MRLLIAFDGSTGAEAALTVALRMARDSDGEILLLHTLHPLMDAGDVSALNRTEAIEIARQREQAHLDVRSSLVTGIKVQGRAEVTGRDEEIATAIVRVAVEWRADFIVVGSRRAAAPWGTLLGSVAARLLQLSSCPVVVVKPGWLPLF